MKSRIKVAKVGVEVTTDAFTAKTFMGKWQFVMHEKRGRREPDPLRAAIRKARREAKKNLTAPSPKA